MLYDLYDDFFRLNREFEKMLSGGGKIRNFPEVNIYSNKEEYIVLAQVPGMDKKDINISLKDNSLKLSGEIKNEHKDKTYYLVERFTGKFERNFMFDEKINAEAINAELRNGILTIHLPKSEEAKPKMITIT